MDINKAIRKQEKSNKRFLFFLGFIFFSLPSAAFAAGRINIFFLCYLLLIDVLILAAIVININKIYLNFQHDDYRLKIKLKFMENETNILCDKVLWVDAEGCNEAMNIVMLMSSKFRSKRVKLVNESFLRQHPLSAQFYYRLKKLNPEINLHYIMITTGGFKKYRLLDIIYRSCTHAHYSNAAIERIKEYRKN